MHDLTLAAFLHALFDPHVVTFADAVGWSILFAVCVSALVVATIFIVATAWYVAVRLGWIPALKGTTQSTGPR